MVNTVWLSLVSDSHHVNAHLNEKEAVKTPAMNQLPVASVLRSVLPWPPWASPHDLQVDAHHGIGLLKFRCTMRRQFPGSTKVLSALVRCLLKANEAASTPNKVFLIIQRH